MIISLPTASTKTRDFIERLPAQRAELEQLRGLLEAAGGRGVALSERIASLDARIIVAEAADRNGWTDDEMQHAIAKFAVREDVDDEFLEPDETIIELVNGRQLRCPVDADCNYVRIVQDGHEIGYWTRESWMQDPAAMGAMLGMAQALDQREKYRSANAELQAHPDAAALLKDGWIVADEYAREDVEGAVLMRDAQGLAVIIAFDPDRATADEHWMAINYADSATFHASPSAAAASLMSWAEASGVSAHQKVERNERAKALRLCIVNSESSNG